MCSSEHAKSKVRIVVDTAQKYAFIIGNGLEMARMHLHKCAVRVNPPPVSHCFSFPYYLSLQFNKSPLCLNILYLQEQQKPRKSQLTTEQLRAKENDCGKTVFPLTHRHQRRSGIFQLAALVSRDHPASNTKMSASYRVASSHLPWHKEEVCPLDTVTKTNGI